MDYMRGIPGAVEKISDRIEKYKPVDTNNSAKFLVQFSKYGFVSFSWKRHVTA